MNIPTSNQSNSAGDTNFPGLQQKPLPPLTRKQRAFVEYALSHPKESYTEAAAQTYNVKGRNVANAIAAENLSKPSIKMALGEANDIVESTLTGVVKEWGSSQDVRERSLAVNTATYIHDKIHGKATQNIKSTSVTASIMVDLTGGKAGEVPPEILAQLEAQA